MHKPADRIRATEEVIKQVELLADTIQLPPASQKAWEYLRHAAYLSVAVGSQGAFRFEEVKPMYPALQINDTHRLRVVVTYPEDALLGPAAQELWEAKCVAAYYPRSHAIALKSPEQHSPRMQAKSLLHEAGHAALAVMNGVAGSLRSQSRGTRMTRAELLEERDMHYTDHVLWEAIGGAAYNVVIDKCLYKLRRELQKAKVKDFRQASFIALPNRPCPFTAIIEPYLEQFLGPPVTDEDRWHRLDTLSIHAGLVFYEEIASTEEEIHDLHVRYMHELYVQIGRDFRV